jgi:hypothetical protein
MTLERASAVSSVPTERPFPHGRCPLLPGCYRRLAWHLHHVLVVLHRLVRCVAHLRRWALNVGVGQRTDEPVRAPGLPQLGCHGQVEIRGGRGEMSVG